MLNLTLFCLNSQSKGNKHLSYKTYQASQRIFNCCKSRLENDKNIPVFYHNDVSLFCCKFQMLMQQRFFILQSLTSIPYIDKSMFVLLLAL